MSYRENKLGILGGGQLGRMMYEAVLKWDLDISFMDQSKEFPVGKVCPNFFVGDFSNYEDVMEFGKDKDTLTIEIESVNLEALFDLKEKGVKVHPRPEALKIIKDKGLQKSFYVENAIPSSEFSLYETADDIISQINAGAITYPFVQKARTGGYDGKGVSVIKGEGDLGKLLYTSSLVEDLVDIEKEIGVIAARNEDGEVKIYDPVEMVFDPDANLVDFLFAPSKLSSQIIDEMNRIASLLISKFDICGLLAVEFFLTKSGDLLVNEVAPRCHNSGHHSIEACITSQFEQHIRGVLNMPLGAVDLISPAVMVNLLGEPEVTGIVDYKGMGRCLKEGNVHLHFYGKSETKPSRKMGHATILDNELSIAIDKAKYVQQTLKVSI